MTVDVRALRDRLAGVSLRDERRLRRRLDRAAGHDDDERRADELAGVATAIADAEQVVARRRAVVPAVTYPAELPITARTDDLAAAIRDHRVVVVAGETGSGKTTQLPKICLELGRGVRGMIGHTQPRRIAARTVADRIAEELGVDLGRAVGYEFRFNRRAGDDTLVKVMTDGILLAGIQSDPMLRAYDTLIIDEAHERSLTIDFLIGYLVQLLPRRPDLKVIITSATIDPEAFSRHFDDAPIVEVSGRMYPVEVRYRPLDQPAMFDDDDEEDAADVDRDQPTAIADAVVELWTEGTGDILVFCSGEQAIREATEALGALDLPDTQVLPLYSRLSSREQRRVFEPHTTRRVVLATNVAETSLTVPGIRYVVDTGVARISRYSSRLKVQRLPIEKVSRASADQRMGRCGRTSDGVCIRLYSEEDYEARPRFTEPEILRTNLASVLLQMAAMRLGEIERFPFLDPPDPRQVRDGLALLDELHAIERDPAEMARSRRRGRRGGRGRRRGRRDDGPQLTDVGRTLARLPVDPRLGRMLIEADRTGCLDEVLVICAALSIPDPRQRPTDARDAADAAHARFADADSDFMTWLHLWTYLRAQRDERSSNQFRKLCRAEYLHHLRVREWQDLVTQLRRVARDLGMRRNDTPAEPAVVHRAVLSGLLSQIGVRDGEGHEYRGARGARFAIQPGSVLFKRPPQWVMAGELVETSRLWARIVARIRPQWAEELGAHLVVRTHTDPWWDSERGQAVAHERVTLYGLPLVTARTVDYGAIDPVLARELFIRHALVEGDWRPRHEFWRVNQRRIAEAEAVEDKLRRRDVVDPDALFAFYDARVGKGVTSTGDFNGWWKRARRDDPHLLDVPREVLLGDAADRVDAAEFPDHVRAAGADLPVSYQFEPGTAADGVTVHVPLAVLHRLEPGAFDWLVPGLRAELVTELLRTLPKHLRRRLVPIPDTARDVLAELGPAGGSLLDAVTDAVRRVTGVVVDRDDWHPGQLPEHLRAHVAVTDAEGRVVAEGDDLAVLQHEQAARVQSALTDASGIERRGLTSWDLGALPRTIGMQRDGHTAVGYPALVDEGDTVAVRVLGSEAEQRIAMWLGTRRLLRRTAETPVTQVGRRLDNATKLALTANPHGSVSALLDDAATAAVDELMRRHGAPVWDAASFAALSDAVRGDLSDELSNVLRTVARIVSAAAEVHGRIAALDLPGTGPARADMSTQLQGLVHAGFITAKSVRRLPDVERYVRAIGHRLDTLARNPDRDRDRMDRIALVQRAYAEQLQRLAPARRRQADVLEIPWLIEELRVGEFAQSLGTARRVSVERIQRAIDGLVA